MTEEKIEGESNTDTRSLDQILGLNFKADGTWTASDVGNSPLYRKMNRRERRLAEKRDRKLAKRFKKVNNG
jgi:hypothetical protein